MLQSISPPLSLTLLTFIFTFLANASLSPSVHAQSFRPAPAYGACSAFTEGQGLYIIGGSGDANSASQSFMLDLSVSWNASAPVFKDLSPSNGPKVEMGACAMTNNGGDLFVLTLGTGYNYNVASNSWKPFSNPNFPDTVWGLSATDPATGIIYFSESGKDFQGNDVVIALDLKTSKVATSEFHRIDTDTPRGAAWSVPLKGMIVFAGIDSIILNPAKTNTPSKGWSTLATTGMNEVVVLWSCAVPAYGGTKVALFGNDFDKGSFVYLFDTVKRSWKKGLTIPTIIHESACAVTGDQFIIWGGEVNEKPTDTMLIYNLKTNKWVTSYTAPPRNTTATTTTLGSGPSQTSTSVPSANETQEPSARSPSNETKYVTIIVAVTAVLMAIILGSIFVYFRRTKRSNSGDQDASPNGSSTGLSDIRGSVTVTVKNETALRTSQLRSPVQVESGPISVQTYAGSVKDQKWHDFEHGAWSSPEHPHAILKEDIMSLRTAQEGVVEVMAPAQHPHAMIDKNSTTTHCIINEWNRDEKHEWLE